MSIAANAEPQRNAGAFGSLNHIFAVINHAGTQGVSDVHVVPGKGTWFVAKDKLRKDANANVTFTEEQILSWLDAANRGGSKTFEPLGDRGHTSVAYDTGQYRVRASYRRTTNGVTVTFRLIPSIIPTVDQLDIPDTLRQLMSRSAGLILVEGATGSGKTTTIAALLRLVYETRNRHIYTIEDPIEFVHNPSGDSLVTQREIGEHASDFPSGVENALRSKPNIIMVGELLNPATAKAALHAATTGHLVMTTAHAGSVTEAIDSFIGQFTPEEQPQIRSRLSQSLLAVICQKLVPTINGGLVAAREILINDLNFQELLRDEKSSNMLHQSIESTRGSCSLEQSLNELVIAGIITPETALNESRKRDAMQQLLDRNGGRR